MILDFKEIPQANTGNGDQDTFELFARDFLNMIGFVILQHPDRGADGKKDLIIQELRQGISGVTKIKWLVSCKHYAHSGKSVSDTDEPNILERLRVHECDGFFGFYSTLPATSLGNVIKGLEKTIFIEAYDRERIETMLLASPEGLKMASRYLPKSFENYKIENPKPAKIFSDDDSILCEHCHEDLLKAKSGIFVTLRKLNDWDSEVHQKDEYVKAYFSCKGSCDSILKRQYTENERLVDEWSDITDFLAPTTYIKRVMAWMNSFYDNDEVLSKEVFEKLKKLLICTYPYISREQTTEEKEKVKYYLQNGLTDWL